MNIAIHNVPLLNLCMPMKCANPLQNKAFEQAFTA